MNIYLLLCNKKDMFLTSSFHQKSFIFTILSDDAKPSIFALLFRYLKTKPSNCTKKLFF